MDQKTVFNIAICVIGIAFLLVHTTDLLLKKNRRKDENSLLTFIIFTAFHFSIYLVFCFIKSAYTSNTLIMAFYTSFYIMNNIEILFLFIYAITYVHLKKKTKDVVVLTNYILFGIFVILDIINIFTHIFFFAKDGVYYRTSFMIFSQGYQFVAFIIVFIITVFNKRLNLTEKIAFSLYCIFPVIAIICQNAFPGYAIAYLSIIISIEILFLFVNVRKNILLADEAKRNKEAEIKIMMSQIQPHFIYNTLASISTLIKIDPDKAQEGLDAFTEYLRANLASLSKTDLIPFSNELKHIETYLSLEKMRFDERLSIIYDIQTSDFLVPPLSIQPIVENAVKHGILKKLEGGVISISTHESPDAYYVEIKDNGVGFDPMAIKPGSGVHIGIDNVKNRLTTMCHADLIIHSEINVGTTVLITFFK